MSLQQQIVDDMKTAMKARDRERVSTLRMLVAATKNKAVELDRGPQGELTDDEVIAMLGTEVKRRRDSAGQYTDAGREELAAKELAEIAIIEPYLPAQLSDDELVEIIDAVIIEREASGPADMGKVMKPSMQRVAGRAEGGRVSAIVKRRLADLGG